MAEDITQVAREGGLKAHSGSTGYTWGPCPKCGADKRGKGDRRGPLALTNSVTDKESPLFGKPGWHCFKCKAGGGIESLAEALSVRVERELPEPEPEPVQEGKIDVAEAWKHIQWAQSAWRDRVADWARRQGWSANVVHAVVNCPDIAAVPDDDALRRVDKRARGPLSRLAHRYPKDHPRSRQRSPRHILALFRDEHGDPIDVERRWWPDEKPDDGYSKTMRAPGYLVGGGLPQRFFGSMPAALRAAEAGEPVIIVEGSKDYAVAAAIVALRGAGAVLAGNDSQLPKLASLLVRKLTLADVPRRSFPAFVIPDVGDNRDNPTSDGWLIGERKAWAAAAQLCEYTDTWWCPPFKPTEQGDLSDYLRDAGGDTAEAFWALINRAYRVLDAGSGKDLDRWKAAGDDELLAQAYRLPLEVMLEMMRWSPVFSGEGQPPSLQRDRRGEIQARGDMSGETRLARAVMAWLVQHGICLRNTAEGQFLFDPLRIAPKPPMKVGGYRRPARALPRLIKIGSAQHWAGWLSHIGEFNTAYKVGRAVEKTIKGRAQRAPKLPLDSWVHAAGDKLANASVRLHTHDPLGRVIVARPGSVTVQANGSDDILQVPTDDIDRPIDYRPDVDAVELSRLLQARFAAHFTLTQPERFFVVCWLLAVPLREQLRSRLMLWGTGPSGAGKSFVASLINAIFTGTAEAGDYTKAGMWHDGMREPFIPVDNKESNFLSDDLLELLLVVSTGGKRKMKSAEGTTRQRFRATIHLSAIGRPNREDLLRRCYVLEHDQRYRNEGHREGEVIAALVDARSRIWSGIMAFYAHQLLPALRQDRHGHFADLVAPGHPNEGMREHLGLMTAIAEQLIAVDPRWAVSADVALGQWLQLATERIQAIRATSDPLGLALQELLFQWNRVIDDRHTKTAYRPAFTERPYACQPLFAVDNKYAVYQEYAGHERPLLTTNDEHARRAMLGSQLAPVIVGFQGSYNDLHRDLKLVARDGDFKSACPRVDDLWNTLGKVPGWSTRRISRTRKGRTYHWLFEPAIERYFKGEREGGDVW